VANKTTEAFLDALPIRSMNRDMPEFDLAKRLPDKSQLERVRAARAILNGTRGTERAALHAFMSIFHPDYPPDKLRSLMKDRGD
jgi:hypothetical protein